MNLILGRNLAALKGICAYAQGLSCYARKGSLAALEGSHAAHEGGVSHCVFEGSLFNICVFYVFLRKIK